MLGRSSGAGPRFAVSSEVPGDAGAVFGALVGEHAAVAQSEQRAVLREFETRRGGRERAALDAAALQLSQVVNGMAPQCQAALPGLGEVNSELGEVTERIVKQLASEQEYADRRDARVRQLQDQHGRQAEKVMLEIAKERDALDEKAEAELKRYVDSLQAASALPVLERPPEQDQGQET